MDAYLPPDDDKRSERPAIIFMHGSGFVAGERDNDQANNFLEFLAVRGYVIFTIDYRMTAQHYGKGDLTFLKEAVWDARAAVRFVHKYHKMFGVDRDRIGLMGASAGAITALCYGYVDLF